VISHDPAKLLWDAWSSDRLCLQGCQDCGVLQHPPSQVCSHCHSTALAVVGITGKCSLLSWSTVHRAPDPSFASEIPYSVVVVSVDDQALVQARLDDDVSVEDLVMGQPMEMRLAEVAGRRIPFTRPA
jgi:uncharacterized OB-fold protein